MRSEGRMRFNRNLWTHMIHDEMKDDIIRNQEEEEEEGIQAYLLRFSYSLCLNVANL